MSYILVIFALVSDGAGGIHHIEFRKLTECVAAARQIEAKAEKTWKEGRINAICIERTP